MKFSIIITVAILFFSRSVICSDYCALYKDVIDIYASNAIFPIETEKFNLSDFKNEFLSITDPYAVIFNSSDQDVFMEIDKLISSNLQTAYCLSMELLYSRYIQRVNETIEVLEQLKDKPLDLYRNDAFYIGTSFKPEYLTNSKKYRCQNYIKLFLIQNLIDSPAYYDTLVKNTEDLQGYIHSIKIQRIEKEIKKLRKKIDSDKEANDLLFYAFVNALTHKYDPHCMAFSAQAFNDFKEELSDFAKLFGLQFETNKKEEIVIASVLPGSYAWKSGLINAGDRVLSISVDSLTSLDVSNASTYELSEFLRDLEGDKITMSLQKIDNTKSTIDVFREQTKHSDNSVQAFILNGEIKVGYIILPAFYSFWGQSGSFGCALDVGRAIYKLKKQSVESLIIDLRNNSGGSIIEALELAGIFIDFGALSIEKNSSGEQHSLKDFNRGTMFSGPLAILVNNNSASASEMVAAVLQDYNRAIIIGDTTYGKATGQALFTLETDQSSVIKLTTNKYYRVTGHNYNGAGVIPDIILPSYYEFNHYSIKKPVLQNDISSKKVYYAPLSNFPLVSLREKSEKRVRSSEKFQQIITSDSLYATLSISNGYLPLSLKGYYTLLKEKNVIDSGFTTAYKTKTEVFSVELLPEDIEMQNMFKYYSDFFLQKKESILKDPYIEETVNILDNYKTLNNSYK